MPCGCNKSKKNKDLKNAIKKAENSKKTLQLNTIKRPVKKFINTSGKK